MRFDLLGHTATVVAVNTASRMMSSGAVGSLHVSAVTAELLRSADPTGHAVELQVRRRSDTHRGHSCLDSHPAAAFTGPGGVGFHQGKGRHGYILGAARKKAPGALP